MNAKKKDDRRPYRKIWKKNLLLCLKMAVISFLPSSGKENLNKYINDDEKQKDSKMAAGVNLIAWQSGMF